MREGGEQRQRQGWGLPGWLGVEREVARYLQLEKLQLWQLRQVI